MAHPQGAIQAGIAVAHDAVGSLGAQPVLLLIVVINVVFLLVGGFFLSQLETTRSSLMIATLDIVRSCVLDTAPLGANSARIKKLEDELEAAKETGTVKEP
jgi:hypothetical protein